MPNSVFLIASNSLTLLPAADNTYDLGSSSFRWANLYAVNINTTDIGVGTTALSTNGILISKSGVLQRFFPTNASGTTWMQVFQGNNNTVTGGLDARGNFHTNLAVFISGGWSMTLNADGSVASVTTANTGLSDMLDVVGDTAYGIVSKGSSTPGHLYTGLDQNANFVFNVDPTGNIQLGAGNTIGSVDVNLSRLAAGVLGVGNGTAGSTAGTIAYNNQRLDTAGTTSGTVTSAQKVVKNITGIANASATATFTITIPNAAHSASVRVAFAGSLGAGGAIGANEATGVIAYDIAVARTAGVNAVATISSAYGSATSSVAGAATITITAAMSTVSGTVSAVNTFTVNVTISHGSGSSTNHTCVCTGEVINANATGITLS